MTLIVKVNIELDIVYSIIDFNRRYLWIFIDFLNTLNCDFNNKVFEAIFESHRVAIAIVTERTFEIASIHMLWIELEFRSTDAILSDLGLDEIVHQERTLDNWGLTWVVATYKSSNTTKIHDG